MDGSAVVIRPPVCVARRLASPAAEMGYSRFVEVGRVAMINYGEDYGKLCVAMSPRPSGAPADGFDARPHQHRPQRRQQSIQSMTVRQQAVSSNSKHELISNDSEMFWFQRPFYCSTRAAARTRNEATAADET